ncbi:Cacna1i [Symbiodinium sp. CCMP2592]|nr:Cacna1i [Symbiodinium sp. CCMP2592]
MEDKVKLRWNGDSIQGMLEAIAREKLEAAKLAKDQYIALESSLNSIFDRVQQVVANSSREVVLDVQSKEPRHSSNKIPRQLQKGPRQLSKVPQTERPVLVDDVDPVPVNPFIATDGDNYVGGWSQSSTAPVNANVARNRDTNVGVWSQSSAGVQSSANASSFSDTSYVSEAFPHTLADTNVRDYTSEKMPHSPSHGPASPVMIATPLDNILSKNELVTKPSRVWSGVKLYIDYVAGFLVLLNTITMLIELQVEGTYVGQDLGVADGNDLAPSLPAMRVLHIIFMFMFVLEWFLRIGVERRAFVRDYANWFDTLMVLLSVVDIYLTLASVQSDGARQSVIILRLMRALKSLRAIRIVRSLRLFQGLRVLVKACTCFLPSLCWSMVLLGIFMCLGALMMGNLLQSYIQDDMQPLEDREWMWDRYGTAYRAWYTLFEITFAGNWPSNVRPVLQKVSHAFVIFFALYITVVVFAIIRVIGAIFLKETLDAAQNDAEQLVKDRMRMKAEYVQKLESVFMAIDDSGNGMITEERLRDILSRPEVAAYFQTLDLDVHESAALFHLLDNGDGEVTLDEFIDGIMRCKGTARAIDQVAMHADLKQVEKKLNKLIRMMRDAELYKSKSQASMKRGALTQANHLKVFRSDMSVHLANNFRQ